MRDADYKVAMRRQLRKIRPDVLKEYQGHDTCDGRLIAFLAQKIWPGISVFSDEREGEMVRYFAAFHGMKRHEFRDKTYREVADALLADIRGASRGGRRRRPRTTAEQKIIEAWQSKRHSTYKDVADLFHAKVKDVARLIRSHQQAARRNHG